MTPINRGEKLKRVILPHRQCREKWLSPELHPVMTAKVFRRKREPETPTSPELVVVQTASGEGGLAEK
jgi:hypothetical protein